MPRIYAMKARTEVEIDMVVVADSEEEALGVAKRFAKKEAGYMDLDIWRDCDTDVEREIRSLEDLPEDFDVDCVAWDKDGVVQADLDDLIAKIPLEPEGGPLAKAKAAMRERLIRAKATLSQTKSEPPAGGGL